MQSRFLSLCGLAVLLASMGASAQQHSADTTAPFGQINLSELLRPIQFYNNGSAGLHCAEGTEDGFAPGAGAQDCAPYAADYNPADWQVGLSELLRVVQFYNSPGYEVCESGVSEDGFCLLDSDVIAEGEGEEEEGEVPAVSAEIEGMPPFYCPDGTATLDITITFDESTVVTFISFGLSLPDGWSYVGIASASPEAPDFTPVSGATDELEFTWISVPASPITVGVRVAADAGVTGPQEFVSRAEYRLSGAKQYTPDVSTTLGEDCESSEGEEDPEGEGEQEAFHSADIFDDSDISFSELLRVVQFYQSYEFSCEVASEDGYLPGGGDQTCAPHDSDYAPQDWAIDIHEVLRLVQFFNTDAGYFALAGTEDGFAVSATPATPPVLSASSVIDCTASTLTITIAGTSAAPVTAIGAVVTLPSGWQATAMTGAGIGNLGLPSGVANLIWFSNLTLPVVAVLDLDTGGTCATSSVGGSISVYSRSDGAEATSSATF